MLQSRPADVNVRLLKNGDFGRFQLFDYGRPEAHPAAPAPCGPAVRRGGEAGRENPVKSQGLTECCKSAACDQTSSTS
jgi:hypothetical protein